MRFLLSAVIAMGVTLALFVLMNALIEGMPDAIERSAVPVSLDAAAPGAPATAAADAGIQPPIPVTSRLPPGPAPETPRPETARPGMPDVAAPAVAPLVEPAGSPSLETVAPARAAPDSDVVPLLTVAPEYPREAVLRRLGGWVDLEFTIETDGGVSDIAVVDASPPGLFDRSARRALAKWRFQPRVVDGETVARRASIRIAFDAAE